MHSLSVRAIAHVIIAGLIATIVATLIVVSITPDAVATEAAGQPGGPPAGEIVFDVFPHGTEPSSFWDSYGARRPGGRRHQGVDILADRGTEIVAVADGVVAAMGESRLSGYFIRIQHAGDWMSVMMHLNNDHLGTDDGEGGTWTAFYPTLMVGDGVKAGQVIGYVGDSGNAEGTTPHTHFELRHNGEKVNPYPYLVGAWNRRPQLTIPVEPAEGF